MSLCALSYFVCEACCCCRIVSCLQLLSLFTQDKGSITYQTVSCLTLLAWNCAGGGKGGSGYLCHGAQEHAQ